MAYLPDSKYTRRATTKWIVIHCSATTVDQDVGVEEIRIWHIRDRGWLDCGYHRVVRRTGEVEQGRPEWAIGSHVVGFNRDSVAVCLVGGADAQGKGENNFTPTQWETLEAIVRELLAKYPDAQLRGHRDFPDVKKACPSFDVGLWARTQGLIA